MPTIEVPLRSVTEIKKLRTNRVFMEHGKELIKITDQIKRLNDRAGELRLDLYDTLTDALADGEKSVQMDGHRLTAIQAEPRRTLDKAKLLRVIPASKLEKCYSVGDPPRPTVQVSRIKDESDREDREIVKRFTKKLRRGAGVED